MNFFTDYLLQNSNLPTIINISYLILVCFRMIKGVFKSYSNFNLYKNLSVGFPPLLYLPWDGGGFVVIGGDGGGGGGGGRGGGGVDIFKYSL